MKPQGMKIRNMPAGGLVVHKLDSHIPTMHDKSTVHFGLVCISNLFRCIGIFSTEI